ncbi:hypothetical protein EMPS_10928 [Entomortierella parvispora]|uniref:SET domain-containing protein n=1 Tax=Entomortierella parvispora TaxID=205924 RepID=A0A9P3HKU1_9FUNG|nr:hypothetical protein EMPS_10928 [Entomortierella parvispora]
MLAVQQCYVIKEAPGKGLGMFATRDIRRGECILAESPLVYGTPDFIETQRAIDAMSPADKESYFALHNVHSDLPAAIGIMKTNGLPLGVDSVECAVYKHASRINHSCDPNVHHAWHSRPRKEYIHAIKDIAAGSEILTSYTVEFKVREERMTFLQQHFMFECQCRLCATPSPEYDETVRRIKIYSDRIPPCASLQPRRSIQYVRDILALLDTIGGNGKTRFYYDAYQICAMYGDYNFAQKWADLLLESYIMDEGLDGDEYDVTCDTEMTPARMNVPDVPHVKSFLRAIYRRQFNAQPSSIGCFIYSAIVSIKKSFALALGREGGGLRAP